MVYLSYLVATALVCIGLGFLLLLFSKSKMMMVFGFLFLIFSGLLLVSSISLNSNTILYFILGFFAISLILIFMFRDELKMNLLEKDNRSEENE